MLHARTGDLLCLVDAAGKSADTDQQPAAEAEHQAQDQQNLIQLFHSLRTSFLRETVEERDSAVGDGATEREPDRDDEKPCADRENAAAADHSRCRKRLADHAEGSENETTAAVEKRSVDSHSADNDREDHRRSDDEKDPAEEQSQPADRREQHGDGSDLQRARCVVFARAVVVVQQVLQDLRCRFFRRAEIAHGLGLVFRAGFLEIFAEIGHRALIIVLRQLVQIAAELGQVFVFGVDALVGIIVHGGCSLQ